MVGTEYAKGDAVREGGTSYVSIKAANKGNKPSTAPTFWEVLAEKGAQGVKGETGANGEKGEKGTTGEKGEKGVSGSAGEKGEKACPEALEKKAKKTVRVRPVKKAKKARQAKEVKATGAENGCPGQNTPKATRCSEGGASYISIKGANKGNKPSTSATFWDALSEKGEKGTTGEKGEKGVTGATGPEGKEGKEGPEGKEGKEGAAAAIVTWGTKGATIFAKGEECLTVSNLGTKAGCISSGFTTNTTGLAFGPVPPGGISIKSLRVESSASVTFTATVLKNGVATELKCNVTGTSCSDETHTVTAVAGEYLEVKVHNESSLTASAYTAAFRY